MVHDAFPSFPPNKKKAIRKYDNMNEKGVHLPSDML